MSTELRRPRATYSGPVQGGERDLEFVTMTMQVGMPPEVSFSLQSGTDAGSRATKISPTDIAQQAGQQQQNTFSGSGSTEDTYITVEDGKGGSITVQGFTNQFSNSLEVGAVGARYTMLQKAYAISRLRTDIYIKDDYAIKDGVPKEEFPIDTNWASRMKKTLENMIKVYKEKRATEEADESAEVTDSIHESNEGPIKAFMEMLEASKETTEVEALGAVSRPTHIITTKIYDFIKSCYRGRNESFLTSTLRSLCAGFQVFYIPSWESYGQLVNMKTVFANPKSVTLPLTGISFDVGASSFDTVTHLLYQGAYRYDTITAATNRTTAEERHGIVAVYPESVVTGASFASCTFPTWMPDLQITAKDPAEAAKLFKSEQASWKLASKNFLKVAKEQVAFTKKISDNELAPLAKEIMRSQYIDVALGASRVSLSVPLDVQSWQAGLVYDVTAEGGGRLFRGLLAAVTHTIQIAKGSANASTKLTFTHVEAGSFELPGK